MQKKKKKINDVSICVAGIFLEHSMNNICMYFSVSVCCVFSVLIAPPIHHIKREQNYFHGYTIKNNIYYLLIELDS